jgi:hypothetical protein
MMTDEEMAAYISPNDLELGLRAVATYSQERRAVIERKAAAGLLAALATLALSACNRSQRYEKCDPYADCYVNGRLIYEASRPQDRSAP